MLFDFLARIFGDRKPEVMTPETMTEEELAQQAKLDAALELCRAERRARGRAAAEKRFKISWDYVSLSKKPKQNSGNLLKEIIEATKVEPLPKEPPKSFIYLIGGVDGPFKNGKSNNVEKWLATLQTGNHIELHILDAILVQNVHIVERRIHEKLAEYRIQGEWFNCNIKTAKEAMGLDLA